MKVADTKSKQPVKAIHATRKYANGALRRGSGLTVRAETIIPPQLRWPSRECSGWTARLPPRRTGFDFRRGFLGDLPSPRPFIPALLHTHLASPLSQDLFVKSRPNLFTQLNSFSPVAFNSSETDLLTNSQCDNRTEHLLRRRHRRTNPRPSDYKSATLPLSYEGRAGPFTYYSHGTVACGEVLQGKLVLAQYCTHSAHAAGTSNQSRAGRNSMYCGHSRESGEAPITHCTYLRGLATAKKQCLIVWLRSLQHAPEQKHVEWMSRQPIALPRERRCPYWRYVLDLYSTDHDFAYLATCEILKPQLLSEPPPQPPDLSFMVPDGRRCRQDLSRRRQPQGQSQFRSLNWRREPPSNHGR
ncbi:hypothetical protein PR048_029252 [Dryococelus australis]|uniref:Uncharacterized protein n=1 Tax=Dryococelus australis TaxID=614101 RepID=A0ABQ9GCX3_9NEOP|nr:hypothetical protein PR048_029252 [Dryococelus australis]